MSISLYGVEESFISFFLSMKTLQESAFSFPSSLHEDISFTEFLAQVQPTYVMVMWLIDDQAQLTSCKNKKGQNNPF